MDVRSHGAVMRHAGETRQDKTIQYGRPSSLKEHLNKIKIGSEAVPSSFLQH
jgi:hypothetical protein